MGWRAKQGSNINTRRAQFGLAILLLGGCRASTPDPRSDDPADAVTPMPVADAGVPDAAKGTDASLDTDKAPGNPLVYLSGRGAIGIFQLDLRTGALAQKGTVSGVGSPGYLAWDPQHRYLYALSGESKVVAFSINADGTLKKINEASTGAGRGPPYLSVHGSGKWVFIAYYSTGHVTVHPVASNGGIGEPVDTQRPASMTAHSVLADRAGKFVFVPCVTPNLVAQYGFNADTGKLTPNDPPAVMPERADVGPRHITFHPSGKFAYVINESSGTMTAYGYDGASGRLRPIQSVPTVPQGFNEHACAHVLVHPSGRFVYGSNREHNSLVIFSVDEMTGRLTLVGHETAAGTLGWPEDFAIDDTGTMLIVGNTETKPPNVIVFEINRADGRLTLRSRKEVANQPFFVGIVDLP